MDSTVRMKRMRMRVEQQPMAHERESRVAGGGGGGGKGGNCIRIEVGGRMFALCRDSLRRLPDSRLARLDDSSSRYDAAADCYWFDRNPELFNWVLDAYRRGTVHFPHNMCPLYILEELAFWNIPECVLAKCCWFWLKSSEVEYQMRETIEDSFTEQIRLKKRWAISKWRDKAYLFLEEPTSSTAAKVWGVAFMCLLALSICMLVLTSMPRFRNNIVTDLNATSTKYSSIKISTYYTSVPHIAIRVVEAVCLVIFMIELIARFLLCRDRKQFCKFIFNILDAIATIPTIIMWCLYYLLDENVLNQASSQSIVLVGCLGVVRVFRLLKFIRHYVAVRVFYLAIKASIREIGLLFMLIFMGMLIFSTLIYFSEFQDDTDFDTIPIGFWWSVVTMTTVGYGDMYPRSAWGYIVGMLCAITGMLFTGMPIPVIASNFNVYYTYANTKMLVVKQALQAAKETEGGQCDLHEDAEVSQEDDALSRDVAIPTSASQALERNGVAEHHKENRASARSRVMPNPGHEVKTDTMWHDIQKLTSVEKV